MDESNGYEINKSQGPVSGKPDMPNKQGGMMNGIQGGVMPDASVQARIAANNQAREMLRGRIDQLINTQGNRAIGSNVVIASGGDSSMEGTKKSWRKKSKNREEANGVALGADINRMTDSDGSAKLKKKVTIISSAVASLAAIAALVIIGVMAMNNTEKDCRGNDGNSVRINYQPEGYGEEPSDSVIVAVFSNEIDDKLESDPEYTYENAVQDYQTAYEETTGGLRNEVTYSYAYFVFRETGDVDVATQVMDEIRDTAIASGDTVAYYTVLANMYDKAGMFSEASYYRELMWEAAPPTLVSEEELAKSMEES